MSCIREEKGSTFIEILIALVMLSIFVAPFLSSFVFARQSTNLSSKVLKATFFAQKTMEDLKSLDTRKALESANFERTLNEDMYVESSGRVFHSENSQLFKIVLLDSSNGRGYITTPSGNFFDFPNTQEDLHIHFQLNRGGYRITIRGSELELTGNLATEQSLLVINAVNFRGDKRVMLSPILSGGKSLRADVYDTHRNTSKISIDNSQGLTQRRLTGFTYRDYTLFRVRMSVFEKFDSDRPLTVMESILRLSN